MKNKIIWCCRVRTSCINKAICGRWASRRVNMVNVVMFDQIKKKWQCPKCRELYDDYVKNLDKPSPPPEIKEYKMHDPNEPVPF